MKEIKVTFKERTAPKAVTRTCVNMSREQIVATYGLDDPDIEWYRFE